MKRNPSSAEGGRLDNTPKWDVIQICIITMRKLLAIVLIPAFVIFGCVRKPGAASISPVALTRSTPEAKRLSNLEPFHKDDGHLRAEGQRQVWEALTSTRGHDMTAKVVFDQYGSVVSVDVQMLARPDQQPSPPTIDHVAPARRGIPEVMPK